MQLVETKNTDTTRMLVLAVLADREEEIKNFRKEKYYLAHLMADGIDAVTEKVERAEAERIAQDCRGKPALITSVKREKKKVPPPKLYNLAALQMDANRLFGYTADQTLAYAQSLYEKKLLTYPGTDSRKLPKDMAGMAGQVLRAVCRSALFAETAIYSPDIKKVLDSGAARYHAIIPTMELEHADTASLPKKERRILELAAGRLLCATGNMHVYETIRAEILCGQHMFTMSGSRVLNNGWKEIEKIFECSAGIKDDAQTGETELPEITGGRELRKVDTAVTANETQPPERFTEQQLLLELEHMGAEETGDGADSIEKLIKDRLVVRDKRKMVPTKEGMGLVRVCRLLEKK